MRHSAIALLTVLIGLPYHAEAQTTGSTAMTIYSTAEPGAVSPELYRPTQRPGSYPASGGGNPPGYAVIRQEREVSLQKGRGTLQFTDVAALIDPTTVGFVSVSDPSTRVVEQNFQFDLVSNERLLQRFLEKPIQVEQTRGDTVAVTSGRLLSASGGLVLQHDDGSVEVLNDYSNLKLPELPGGLITRPTLVWDLFSEKAGPQKVRVTYETAGMTWWADYNVTFKEGDSANTGSLDVAAWVSILNQSGAGYPEAKLKLVAGKPHRVPRAEMVMMKGERRAGMDMMAAPAGFEEKSFFEYHMYTLGHPTTLPDRSTKQIELFPVVRRVPCEKVLVYYGQPIGAGMYFADPVVDRDYGTTSNKEVDTYLRFRNAKDAGLGIPLPAGRIRVSKLDPADDSLEFIGEDRINHTPHDETVQIKLGTAFDVVGERKQTDFSVDTSRKVIEEEFEITLRNHKDQPVKVIVKENLARWSAWTVIRKSQDFNKTDARTIEFPVTVAKDGEAKVSYRVRYTW